MKTVCEICDEYCRRLDVFVGNVACLTRTHAQKLIAGGGVTVNGKVVTKCAEEVAVGDEVSVTLPDDAPLDIQAENIPLDIVYEDEDLAVINKPQGMIVHPTSNIYTGTLVNALLYCVHDLSGINGVLRPGIVHRLDKDTSGLLVVAKNDFAHVELQCQIQVKTCRRIYLALLEGNLKLDDGFVDKPIGRSKSDRKKMSVTYEHSKKAITHYEVLEEYRDFSHIRCQLETGRTHQIRVHMAYVGHPIAGDPVYGPKKIIGTLQGQCLHAKKIGFIHPSTKEYMEFDSLLPEYFTRFLATVPQK